MNIQSAEAALRLARKALELEPYNTFYKNTLGVVLYRLGRFEDAVRCLEANVPQNGEFAAFDLYFLAMASARLNQHAKARDFLNRANAAVKSAPFLSAQELAELVAFRAEAESILNISQK
jgi:lipopolysaccharide biosynthesis regulator YciM